MTEIENLEVKSYEDIEHDQLKIIVVSRHADGKYVCNLYTGEWKLIPYGDPIPPEFIIKIHSALADVFFKALQKLLSSKGIKTESESKLEGELIATKKHLEDLRSILIKDGVM